MAIITFGDGTNAGYVEKDTGSGANTSVSATLGWAQAGGDLILVEVSFAVSVGPVVAGYPQDTSGNTYTFVESQTDPGSNFTVALYECRSAKKAAAGANAVTVHVTTAGAAGDLLVTVFGATAPGYVWIRDQINKASGTSATPANGSITTAFANTFAVALISVGNTIVSPFPGAPWTNETVDPNGGQESYAINTSTLTLAPTYNQSPSGVYAALIASYGASPAAPTLAVNQRAPGFPRSAPPPGVSQLGRGVLVPPTVTGVARTMQVSIAGAATIADALSVTRGMVDAILGQATEVFSLTRNQTATTLAVQVRAPGFPIGAPIPGIARLGLGVLVPVTPAGVARAMAVAIQGAATLGDALSVTRALADIILGAATLADPLNVTRALTDGIHGVATVGDSLSVTRAMTDAIAGHATVADALSVTRALTDAIHGAATVTDAMAVARALVDGIVGAATLSDAASVTRPLTLAALGQGALVFGLTVTIPGNPASFRVNVRPPWVPMSMPLPGVARLGRGVLMPSSPGLTRSMQLAIVGGAIETDALGVARPLSDAISGAATVGDTLGVQRGLVEAIAAHASVAEALGVRRGLVDAIAGAASLSLADVVARGMALAAGGHAVLFLNNSAVPMAVAIAGDARLSAALGRVRSFQVAILDAATMSAVPTLTRGMALAILAVSHGTYGAAEPPALVRLRLGELDLLVFVMGEIP